MSTAHNLSLCFAAYNEEETLKSVLEDAHRLLSLSGLDYEILVCNDGSSDATGEIAESESQRLPRLRVFHHRTNQGIIPTIKELYARATKEYVFINSADKQWDNSVIFDLLKMTDDYDLIIASRTDKHYSFSRQIVSFIFNFIPMIFFSTKTYDAGAAKLIKREILAKLPNISSSPFSEAERIIRAKRAGYRITHYPTEIQPRKTGKARGTNIGLIVASIVDCLRVWWNLRFS